MAAPRLCPPCTHLPSWLVDPAPPSPQRCGAWRPGPSSAVLQAPAHQGDEVGEGELQAHVDYVRLALGGPQVAVVVVHQVLQQPLLLVPALGACDRQP